MKILILLCICLCCIKNSTNQNSSMFSDYVLNGFFFKFEKKFGHLKKLPNDFIIPQQKSPDPKVIHKSLSSLYAEKIIQNMENILLISIDEYQVINKDLILEDAEANKGILFRIFGKKSCSLDDQGDNEVKSVCPWHYELRFRQNMYPHRRVFSKCNCDKCLIHSKFDNNHIQFSACTPVYTMMPAMIREKDEWNFVLENVPTSCQCSVKLNPF